MQDPKCTAGTAWNLLFQALDIHHSKVTLQLLSSAMAQESRPQATQGMFWMHQTHGSELNSHNFNFRPSECRLVTVSEFSAGNCKERGSASSNAKDKWCSKSPWYLEAAGSWTSYATIIGYCTFRYHWMSLQSSSASHKLCNTVCTLVALSSKN